MPADVVLGMSLGDEGKGKVVDYFSECYDYVVRFNGGNNAGHTLTVNGRKTSVHALPSGILHPHVNNVIGNGCVVDPFQLVKEIEMHGGPSVFKGRLFISHAAHLITPTHIYEDKNSGKNIGTTGKGIGPTYSSKMARTGLRMEDFENDSVLESIYGKETINLLKPFITDTKNLLQLAIKSGANVLLEGAQGSMLDIDHGTYPYVTSSNCTIGAALTGTGLNHKQIRKVYGVTKAYTTRVGEGPFLTEQNNEIGNRLRELGGEVGTTTGRPRRCGWLNGPELRQNCLLNGVDELIVTKLDILDSFDKIQICVSTSEPEPIYISLIGWNTQTKGLRDKSKLPKNLLNLVEVIGKIANIPVTFISTSPERNDVIKL